MNAADLDIIARADFRSGSKARRVAAHLLAGGAWARQDLAAFVGVSESTVNRAVGKLEEQGVEFTKRAEGRHVVFQRVMPKLAPAPPPYRGPRGHDVIVYVRDGDGFIIGDRVTIDGEPLLVPRGSKVSVDVSGDSVGVVTFTVFAASVRFETIGGAQ